jgi:heme A synthase
MTTSSPSPADRIVWFPRIALLTALLTFGLIVFGAVVRVTDSGLGCGNQWPLCHGSIIPPLDNITAWIEWLHRLFAVLIGLFGIGTLVLAIRAYHARNRAVLTATITAAVLFAVQSGLGAIVVVLDLPPTFVTLHLGTAMLLFAALLLAGVLSIYKPEKSYKSDQVTTLIYITAALSLVIILTGALVRGSGSTLACTDWPLCNGQVIPTDQGRSALIHMFHRASVLGLGVAQVLLVWQVFHHRQSPRLKWLSVVALVIYLAQAAVGALFVLSAAAPIWGAAHVGMAAATWGLLVVVSIMEWQNTRQAAEFEPVKAAWQH